MSETTSIKKEELIAHYMEHVLTHGKKPTSVYAFVHELTTTESNFYAHFGSFESLEQQIFAAFFEQSIQLLHKSEEYAQYNPKEKLLSFYFTFFELLTANRSYVLFQFNDAKTPLNALSQLKSLRNSFKQYVEDLNLNTSNLGIPQFEDYKQKGVAEAGWLQLLGFINFWKNDSSPSFEKTDQFIEKSVKVSTDLLESPISKSIVDLGKFMFKEAKNWK